MVVLSDLIAEQFRMPSGVIAPMVAASLNRRNRTLIEQSIIALDVRSGQRALDVGFGGGLSLVLLAAAVGDGHVAGVDPSPEMVSRARHLLAPHLKQRSMSIEQGAVESIPFSEGSFDRVLTCQTVYFWTELKVGMAELYRVLAPGGRLAVAMMPRPLQEHFGFAERGYRVLGHDQLVDVLQRYGFTEVSQWGREAREPWVVTAHRPATAGAEVLRSACDAGSSGSQNGRTDA